MLPDVGRVAGLAPEETRQRVLDAAAKVFAERGFEGARVAHIAKASGLSVGAIYNHYGSKAELLAAVVEQHSDRELVALLAGNDTTPTGVPELIEVLGAGLIADRPGASLLAEVILAARRDPTLATGLAEQVARREGFLGDLVRFGQTSGDIVDDVDPAVVARFCLMLALGSLLVRTIDVPATDADAWRTFIARLVDGFRPGEQP